MTTRLYYDDPYLAAFDATVVSVDARDAHTAVTLDRSRFYPTSGGQPFDTGTLNGVRVVEVVDRDDGTVEHLLERGAPAAPEVRIGEAVHGEIDWPRRF